MTAPAIVVWSAGRVGGIFHTMEAALRHVRICANDHRPKPELHTPAVGAVRYVGPRGRRHGTRLVAFIGTPIALGELGIDVGAVVRAVEHAS